MGRPPLARCRPRHEEDQLPMRNGYLQYRPVRVDFGRVDLDGGGDHA
jgi:hypothetical protein